VLQGRAQQAHEPQEHAGLIRAPKLPATQRGRPGVKRERCQVRRMAEQSSCQARLPEAEAMLPAPTLGGS
jgi:hypothetical protein